MHAEFDIAVIGSGFAGSLIAMIAKRLGRSVVLLERGRHPRFAIGESATPLANLLLEELADRYDLPRLMPLAKWGTWQRTYPKIACGLKRGFTFYHHPFGRPFCGDGERRDQLLVAASPRDEIADTHWYRPDLDYFLVREALAIGVEYHDGVRLNGAAVSGQAVHLEGDREGKNLSVRARFVVDASGPRGFLWRALSLPETGFKEFPTTHALYTHFRGVRRWDELFPSTEPPPYPVDDAAVHHVFEGGWIWVLRFNNGTTSAGVAATDKLARALQLQEGGAAWQRLLQRLPTLGELFAPAETALPFRYAPRLAFRCGRIVGSNWALLPSAAGVVDPLLSTGFPLTLLGASRLARLLEEDWGSPRFATGLVRYAGESLVELDATARLVAALYARMNDFASFAGLSLLYFAATSYCEAARRLGRPELARSFLLCDDPRFGRRLRDCCEYALQPGGRRDDELKAMIVSAIEPIDVTGLTVADRRNWYPVRPEDLLRSASRLNASDAEMRQMLLRQGMILE